MPGILDNKLGDLLKGGGAAAALGANPLLGILAGPTIRRNRERRELENRRMRDEITARDDLVGLLNRNETVRAPGKELLSIDGPSTELPGKRVSVPAHRTQGGQQELMGILARINPEAAVQAALPQQGRADPSVIREMQALGYPLTKEGFQQYQQDKGTDNDPLAAFLAAESLRQRQNENQRAEEEARQTAEERRVSRETRNSSLNKVLRNVSDLSDANDKLTESFLRPGAFVDARRTGLQAFELAKRWAGGDTKEEQEILKAAGNFEKGAANLLQDLLPQLEGINANTDGRLAQIQKSLANLGTEPGTNAKILSETIFEILDIADINNFNIQGRDQMLRLASNLRNFKPESKVAQPPADVDPAVWNAMTPEEKALWQQ